MDNLTHTLIGVAVAESGLSKKIGRGTTWILAIASNLPDLDIAIVFSKIQDAFLYRRMLTHSILGVPIIALAAAAIFKSIFKTMKFGTAFALCLLGMGLHVFFDLLNSYGVVALFPISMRRFEFSTLFIIDLFIWALLLFPLLLSLIPAVRRSEEVRRRLWLASTITLFVYVGICFAGRVRANQLLLHEVEAEGLRPQFTYVFPEALGCHRFRGVERQGTEYKVFQINVLKGTVQFFEDYETLEGSLEVEEIRKSKRAQKLEWFTKAPVWQEDGESRGGFVLFDLRFISTVILRGNRFSTFHFTLPEGAA